MKTLADLEQMKTQPCQPFESAYIYLMKSLENFYISKVDGKERIIHELKKWDSEAQTNIIAELTDMLGQSGLMDFDPDELKKMIS